MKENFYQELYDLLEQPKKIGFDKDGNIVYKGFKIAEDGYNRTVLRLLSAFVEGLKNTKEPELFFHLLYNISNTRKYLTDTEYPDLVGEEINLESFIFESDISDSIKMLLVKNNKPKIKEILDYELYTLDSVSRSIGVEFRDRDLKFGVKSVNKATGSKVTFIGQKNTLIYFLWTLYKTKRFKIGEDNLRKDFETFIVQNFNFSSSINGKPHDIKKPDIEISKIIGDMPVKKEDFLKRIPEKSVELLHILESIKSEISSIITEIENTNLRD